MPIRARGKIFNDYNYAAMFPVVVPEDMQAQGEKAEAALGGIRNKLQALRAEYRQVAAEQIDARQKLHIVNEFLTGNANYQSAGLLRVRDMMKQSVI